jgi:hypothetical protein
MHRQGWHLQLTEVRQRPLAATFYVTGMTHSIIGGSAWEATPAGGAEGGVGGNRTLNVTNTPKVLSKPRRPNLDVAVLCEKQRPIETGRTG